MAAEERTMTLADLERMMQMHDWLYGFTDDHSVWVAGQAAESRLNRACKELSEAGHKEEVDRLYARYCPEERKWM